MQKWYNEKTSVLSFEANYINHKKNGIEKAYYDSGKLLSETLFSNDRESGSCKFYYESGIIKREINYKDGEFEGNLFTFWENGKIKRSDLYNKGELISGKTYDVNGKETEYYTYRILPIYAEGKEAYIKYMKDEIKYPENAKKKGISGEVVVNVYIETDGTIKEATIYTSIDKELDEEALRVIKNMGKWTPFIIDGEKIRLCVKFPVKFSL